MYESPQRIRPEHLSRRIYAPVSYGVVRTTKVVRIVHGEAFELSGWFPLVWHLADGRPEFVAVRSLLNDGLGHPTGSPQTMASLPLLLRAYPFLIGEDAEEAVDSLMMDDIPADAPTDIGAPIREGPGRYSRGGELKLRALAAFAQDRDATQAVSRALGAGDLFAPWPLAVDVKAGTARMDGLFVLKPPADAAPRMRSILARHGQAALAMVAAHRVSLFRAGVVLKAARRAAEKGELG